MKNKTYNQTSILALQTKLKHKNYWLFLLYLLPLAIVLVVSTLLQWSVADSCASLPQETRGQCSAGWILFAMMPILFVGGVMAGLAILAGMIHLTVSFSRRKAVQNRASVVLVTVVLIGIAFISAAIFATRVLL